MNRYTLSELNAKQIKKLIQRPSIPNINLNSSINEIRQMVELQGDLALKNLTAKFDGARIDQLRVTQKEILSAEPQVDESLKNAIKKARHAIETFHSAQFQIPHSTTQTYPGVICWREFRPIERVGLYIPGGSAPLFSTVLMLGIPAKIAGCEEITICTPPQADGKISPVILWTANLLGITNIFKVGGAQAIFALAKGTDAIPKVDKIFGPGNQYVTAAKQLVSTEVSIDMPAGPSEVLVIADEKSDPKILASDILSQAEHGSDSQSILVSTCNSIIDKTIAEISNQIDQLSRAQLAKQAIANSYAIKVDSVHEAIAFSNEYAPEHLIVAIDDFEKYLSEIRNAGSVFCGPYSAESFGDYASGTNHTLPTAGFARSVSALSVRDFVKTTSFQNITQQGFDHIAEAVEIMAKAEGLDAHKNAVAFRRNL